MHVDEAVVTYDTGLVAPEGEALQILFRRQSGGLSLALLIHPVPMDVRESRIVDGRE